MDLVYLDYNCFQRSFDDPRQIRIQMETLACQEIFLQAERANIELIWSFIHEHETFLCPAGERKTEIRRLANLCHRYLGTNEIIRRIAFLFEQKANLAPKDAIHLACADYINADFFLTCDDKLSKRAKRLSLDTRIMNPIEYIRKASR